MMGVSVPDLPPSLSEDNINLGEKDSVRRRALWALEGKGDVAFSKVEIPELDTSNAAEKKFDFRESTDSRRYVFETYTLCSEQTVLPSRGWFQFRRDGL